MESESGIALHTVELTKDTWDSMSQEIEGLQILTRDQEVNPNDLQLEPG